MKYAQIIKELSYRINKKLAVFVLVAISIIVFGFINWKAEELPKTLVQPAAIAQEPDLQNAVIYYYGEECPRCKKLEKFIDNNKITDKISLIKR